MFKKILSIIGNITLGLNFGMISAFSPILLVLSAIIFPEDFVTEGSIVGFSIAIAAITAVCLYVYSYRTKREHNDLNVNVMTFWISFIVGALLTAVFVYIVAGDINHGMPNRLL